MSAARWISEQHENRNDFINFSEMFELDDQDDVYKVQDALELVWQPSRGKVAGYKLALTSKPIQELFGVDTPMKGNIFSDNILFEGQKIKLENYVHLGIEFELAVEIGEDFDPNGHDLNEESCLRRISAVFPAFELIDDRNADYSTVDLKSLTADNSWNANNVLGKKCADFDAINFNNNSVSKTVNGKVEHSHTGAALGNPINSVIWIAKFLATRGKILRAGQIIMTGSTFATYFPKKGDTISYLVDGIGPVSLEVN
jgi:2-keto-4-pentenoate hydratase